MLAYLALELTLFTASVLSLPTFDGFLGGVLNISMNLDGTPSDPSNSSNVNSSSKYVIPTFSNARAASFHVNSSALPLVTFPLQDSWAGHLPVSYDPNEDKKLYFWYWPSSAPGGSKDLTIWLNGGPGCSSLEGWLQENGPLDFEPGTSAPVPNPNGWTTVSDMLYIDQPAGTGFAVGVPTIHNESELADQFYGFLQQFYGVFTELQEKSLTIAGESYAGYYIPYIATRIVEASSAEKASLPLKLQGLLMNDGCYTSGINSEAAPTPLFAQRYQSVLGLSDDQVNLLLNKSAVCGYDTLLAEVTYPPKGMIPLPNGNKDVIQNGCDLANMLYTWVSDVNPCFNVYRITDKCPAPQDPLNTYFNRSDVQDVINVPDFGPWEDCASKNVYALGGDQTLYYPETLMPQLLAALPRGITLWHGELDALLMYEGDRIMIQNMTWNGAQGFQREPNTPLMIDGQQKGTWHSERGLTYIEVENAGHMVPQDQAEVGLRVFSYALGLSEL